MATRAAPQMRSNDRRPLFFLISHCLSLNRRTCPQGPQDSESQDEQYDAQKVNVEARPECRFQLLDEQHFQPDYGQDHRQRQLEKTKPVDHVSECEVEAPQSQDREDVAREDQKWVGGDCKDSWNRIDRKNEVR